MNKNVLREMFFELRTTKKLLPKKAMNALNYIATFANNEHFKLFWKPLIKKEIVSFRDLSQLVETEVWLDLMYELLTLNSSTEVVPIDCSESIFTIGNKLYIRADEWHFASSEPMLEVANGIVKLNTYNKIIEPSSVIVETDSLRFSYKDAIFRNIPEYTVTSDAKEALYEYIIEDHEDEIDKKLLLLLKYDVKKFLDSDSRIDTLWLTSDECESALKIELNRNNIMDSIIRYSVCNPDDVLIISEYNNSFSVSTEFTKPKLSNIIKVIECSEVAEYTQLKMV